MTFDVGLLTDPELYLPSHDDPALGTIGQITAVGSFTVTVASPAELLAIRSQVETGLDLLVQPHQQAVVPPCHVVREVFLSPSGPVTIYGRAFSPDEAYATERESGATPAEADVLRYRVADALQRNWLWGRWWSSLTSEVAGPGELGCCHRAHIDHVITEAEFETARKDGWP